MSGTEVMGNGIALHRREMAENSLALIRKGEAQLGIALYLRKRGKNND